MTVSARTRFPISALVVALVMSLAPVIADSAHAAGVPASQPAGKIEALDAWIPEAPPGSPVHAAYLTIRNGGAAERAVVSVACADYGMAHLHLSAMQGGVAVMQPVARAAVPAGGEVKFEPSGLHVMLMRPKRKLAVGDKITLTLGFEDGGTLDVIATVMARMHGGSHHHQHKHSS